MSGRHLLVIEDDAAIRRGIADALALDGFSVSEAEDADGGLALALELDVDLVLLDLVLPGDRVRHGLEVLEQVRRERPTMPVIILTALGDEADRVRGLRLGADDYVVKPFSVDELRARVQAVLRRSPERPSDLTRVEMDDGLIDLERREVCFEDGERCALSEREAELILYLARNAGRVVSRQELLSRVWRIDPTDVATRTIDMHVTRLREKLRERPTSPRLLMTVRGKGYKFGGRT
ncbi:MAG: DNA-binding response regulator [Phycisphaeraceae bacterium]|nr:DNA-binding response regulator [Phycisphaeraceae bacterium]